MRNYANMKKWQFSFGDPRTIVFKALSCEHRIKIIEMLKYGEQSVSEIASFLSIHPSVVSRHLSTLHLAGLIVGRKEGVEVYYRLSSNDVMGLLEVARKIVEEKKRLTSL